MAGVAVITGIRLCMGLNMKWWAILSPIISYLDKYPASHSWIEIDYHGQTWIYESIWPRSRRVLLDEHRKTYKLTKMWELPVNYSSIIYTHYLEERKNIKYSFLQIITIGIGLFIRPFNSYFESVGLNESKHLICTELCAYFLKDLYDVEFTESLDTIGLRDLDAAVATVGRPIL
jgi:hypothetical protein